MAEVAQEEGISAATLYNWRQKARQAGRFLPDQSDNPKGWSSQDKFHAVLETAPSARPNVPSIAGTVLSPETFEARMIA
ncbi:transposase [Cobetia marina]